MKKRVLPMLILGIVLVGLILFIPAGSLGYWQAWLFMFSLFTPVIFITIYFLKHDKGLLERRMKLKEKETKQKIIVKIASLLFLISFIFPGLDYRYSWSDVPIFLVIISNIMVFLGYFLIFLVFKENSYTSRVIEVAKKQKIITTGPYSIVRHPMYLGLSIIFFFISTALGSFYGMIFFIPIIITLIFRIFNEEKFLLKNLKGYKEYVKKVKYRLIPYIW